MNTNKNSRTILIVAVIGAACILIAFLFVLSLKNVQETGPSSVRVDIQPAADQALTDITDDNTSTEYIDQIEAANALKAAQAERRGDSHADILSNATSSTLEGDITDLTRLESQIAKLETMMRQTNDRMNRLSTRGNQRTKVGEEPHYFDLAGVEYMTEGYRAQEQQAMLDVMTRLRKASTIEITPGSSTIAINAGDRGDTQRSINRNSNTPGATGVSTGLAGSSSFGAGLSRTVVLPASDEIHYAKLNLGINTDIGGIASATIIGGDYHGTILTAGSFDAARKHLRINFDQFHTKDGESGNISAVAVDLDEGVAAIKGKYKARYGLRVGGAVLASIMEGYGRVVSDNVNRTNVFVDGNLVSSTNEGLTDRQALKGAGVEAGRTLGSFVRDYTNKPPTTSKAVDSIIGVYIYRPGVLSGIGATVTATSDSDGDYANIFPGDSPAAHQSQDSTASGNTPNRAQAAARQSLNTVPAGGTESIADIIRRYE